MANMLRIITLGFICCTLLLSLFVPLQTDEVFYKLINARLFADDGVLITLFPQCRGGWEMSPPLLWLLPRTLESWVHSQVNSLADIRLLGIVTYAFILAGFYLVVKRMGYGRKAWVVIIALLSLDMMPFLMVMNRPEQSLVLCVLLFVILGLWAKDREPSMAGVIAGGAFYLLLVMVFASLHPKAFMFLPLVWCVGYQLGAATKRRWIGFGYAALASVTAFFSVRVHMARSACPENPDIVEHFSVHYLSPSAFFHSPLETIISAVQNILLLPDYFMVVWLAQQNGGLWLARQYNDMSATYLELSSMMSLLINLAYAVGVLWLVWQCLKVVRQGWKTKKISHVQTLAISLLLSLIALSAVQSFKMFYEVTLVLPVVVMLGILIWPTLSVSPEKLRRNVMILLVVALASQLNLWAKFHGFAWAEQPRSYDNILKEGALSRIISAHPGASQKTRQDILAAGRACEIPPRKPGQYIITDMLTYMAYKETYRPLSYDYISDGWYKPESDLRALYAIMREKRSSGMVLLCAATPEALRKKMIQTGDFCCMPALSE